MQIGNFSMNTGATSIRDAKYSSKEAVKQELLETAGDHVTGNSDKNINADTKNDNSAKTGSNHTVKNDKQPHTDSSGKNIHEDKEKYELFGKFGKAAFQLAETFGVKVEELHTKLTEVNADFRLQVGDKIMQAMNLSISFKSVEYSSFSFERAVKNGESINEQAKQAGEKINQELQDVQKRDQEFYSRVYQLTLEREHETSIEQSYQFNAKGVVQTSDGREINIDMQLNMASSLYSKVSERLEILSGEFIDPLVINFDAPAAALAQTKFEFDLDANGTQDQVTQLAQGSGFLAIDLNKDGKINDGSELFGTKSGDGFGDLAAFDQDSNGWIDEGDDIFDKLRIWAKDETGKDQLLALGEKGIGAIYLGNAKGDYALGNLMQPEAVIRSTGIFLREDGTGGTIQHVDFSV